MAALRDSKTIDLGEMLPKQLWLEVARDIPNAEKPAAAKKLQDALVKAAAKIWPVCVKAKSAKKSQVMKKRQAKMTKHEKDALQDKCQQGRAHKKDRSHLLVQESDTAVKKMRPKWGKGALRYESPKWEGNGPEDMDLDSDSWSCGDERAPCGGVRG
jgi:hypothetical protein